MRNNPQSDAVRDGVREAIRTIIACEPPIDDETALLHDLGIAGDDAWELMELIVKRFPIDATGFEFAQFSPAKVMLFHFGSCASPACISDTGG